MKTKIYISTKFIYKVETTGNPNCPLAITCEYTNGAHGLCTKIKETECPDAGLLIKNLGGPDAMLEKCTEVDDLAAWVADKNAAAKKRHEKAHAVAMQREAEREAQIKAEYERLFAGEVTETNEKTVRALLRYLNTQNWGGWELPKMTIGYRCNQYDCDGKQATTIILDRPIMVNDKPGTMFQVGAPIGHLMKYRRILIKNRKEEIMRTYSFSYINQFGNGEVVEVKDFANDQEAMEHGCELLKGCVGDYAAADHWRADNQNPEMFIDKWANGYPAEETFGTGDEVEPIATAVIEAEFSDDHKTINYKEEGF